MLLDVSNPAELMLRSMVSVIYWCYSHEQMMI